MIAVLIACPHFYIFFFSMNLASAREKRVSESERGAMAKHSLAQRSISPRSFSSQTRTRSTISKEEMEGL